MTEDMKVGELARRTGLSVRTLHHYDEIGLLSPARRTRSNHRVYALAEVRRLQQIASLRQLGLSLEEIRACLERPGFSLERVLEIQIERIREEIGRQERLRALLEHLRRRLDTQDVTVEEITRAIEETMSFETYYTPEQLEQLARRAEQVGQARIQEVQTEWTELFAAYKSAMEEGLDPASEQVGSLARRSAALVREFTGGDPGIAASLNRMYQQEGGQKVVGRHGMDTSPELWEYMARARAALEGNRS